MAALAQSFQKQDKSKTKSVVVIYFNLSHKTWGIF